ncbi:hypothetical protein ES705_27136 [subsurface metagenome]
MSMEKNDKTKAEKRFIIKTTESLASKNEEEVLSKLNELMSTGKVSILPFILDLLDQSSSDKVKREVILFMSNLKNQKCAPVIIDYILKNKSKEYIYQVISSCWQSRLDYSKHLKAFVSCFIAGDYQIALESFTVIEEMLWRSEQTEISECRKTLISNLSKIDTRKKLLYDELINVLS